MVLQLWYTIITVYDNTVTRVDKQCQYQDQTVLVLVNMMNEDFWIGIKRFYGALLSYTLYLFVVPFVLLFFKPLRTDGKIIEKCKKKKKLLISHTYLF